jgi:amino acid transporter
MPEAFAPRRVPVLLVTTVLLSFISFWRAAAIVLSDLGSTAFYIGGIAEHAIGKAAPWFILGVMLFSYAVRAVYIESSAMFVRGGVYRVVKEAMGGGLAKLTVSALLFDYVLTGPISSVSAGQYVGGLVNDLFEAAGRTIRVPDDFTAVSIAIAVTIYFWWRNIRGLHESSRDALRIMQITTVMVVVLVAWCGLTIFTSGGQWPPAPTPANLDFSEDALGWLSGTVWPSFTVIAILVGFGHSILAMSGEESLAQVYREIERPKVQNLKRAGLVIFVYSLVFTSLVSFFAVAIIPDSVRPEYFNNLISGLSMHLVGPEWLRLAFQIFVVIVGMLILAGAVNTSIVGSNGVLSRLSEDGVLSSWFRRPHRRFGTNYRLVNAVAALQVFTIVVSRGNVYLLGEAYAFGVVWSFAFKALAVLVLRFKDQSPREWRVPGNVRVGGMEIPAGLALIATGLFAAAAINLVTKQAATLAGVAFTAVFYLVFVVSERRNAARARLRSHVDEFQLLSSAAIQSDALGVGPDSILVPVRDYNTLRHLDAVLDESPGDRDIVVMTVRQLSGPDAAVTLLHPDELFTDYEQRLFTNVVAVAERHGRSVKLMIVPSANVFDAIAQTAAGLGSSEIASGESAKMPPREQARLVGDAWERCATPTSLAPTLTIYRTTGEREVFYLGPHAPDLRSEDIELIHRLWTEAVRRLGPRVQHRDVVKAGLYLFDKAIHTGTGDAGWNALTSRGIDDTKNARHRH